MGITMFLACRFVYSHTFIPGAPLIHIPSNFQAATMSSPFSINPLMTTRNILQPAVPGFTNFPWLPFNLLTCEKERENRSKKFMKSTSKSLKNRFNFLNGIRIHLHNSLFYPTIRFLFAPLSNGFRSTDTLRIYRIETNQFFHSAKYRISLFLSRSFHPFEFKGPSIEREPFLRASLLKKLRRR